MMGLVRALAIVGLAAVAAGVAARAQDAPRAGPRMEFTPPAAGSYVLAEIQSTPSGRVLDTRGRRHDLADDLTGKVTLLSLFYSQCADPEGCPLAFNTMIDLRDRIAEGDPAVRDHVRLASLSFDPAHDTPAMLAGFAENLATRNVEWRFLTAASPTDLQPILDSFGQEVSVVSDGDDGSPRVISHVLKVFLIDPRGMVREIYSTAYLLPDVVYNDILTLLIEDGLVAQ